MSRVFIEKLNQGLVTSRQGSLLQPGELTSADDAVYHPNDPAIHRGPGRTEYIPASGTVDIATKIKGLNYLQFDNNLDGDSDSYIIAYIRDTLQDEYHHSVFSSRSGTFTQTEIGVGDGPTLDAVHYRNRYYLLNGNIGKVANRVFKAAKGAPTTRRHGLVAAGLDPSEDPTITTAAGSWPLDEVFWGVGRFFFWTTEVIDPGGTDELESAFTGEPPFIDLQKNGAGVIPFDVTVSRHATLSNPGAAGATEIRFYMAKASLFQSWDNSLLTRGHRVGTAGVSGTPTNDAITLTDSFAWVGPSQAPLTAEVDSGTVGVVDNVKVKDGSTATIVDPTNTGVIDIYDYGFSLPGGTTVQGVKVYIRWKGSAALGHSRIQCQLGLDLDTGSPTLSAVKTFNIGAGDFETHIQGDPGDTWGLTLNDVNTTDAQGFGVRLTVNQLSAFSTSTTEIDSVDIRLITANIPTIGPNYPVTSVQISNVTFIGHSNLPPPTASTGDIYEGQLVINNVENPLEFVWSLPLQPDYFPQFYKMTIPTKMLDNVKVIRRVGDILVVWREHSIYRINFLPRNTDPEFDTGRAFEELSGDHGGISTQSVTIFTPPVGPTMACYASSRGLHITDGAQVIDIGQDLDWPNTVDVPSLASAVLINYPTRYQIWFYYDSGGGGENDKVLVIHYHPSLQKADNSFPITGPLNYVSGACAAVGRLGPEYVLLTGHVSDGKVYVEDNGVDDVEGTGINPNITTRELYPAAVGYDWTAERTWIHKSSSSPAMTLTITPQVRVTGAALTNQTALITTTTNEGLSRLEHHFDAEGVRYSVTSPDADPNNAAFKVDYIAYLASGQGFEDR